MPRRYPFARRAGGGSGFSLIELMVVVAVAAIIIGLAAPSFSSYILTQRIRSVHAQLVTDLQFARSEAATRGQFVAVQFQHRAGSTDADGSCYIVFARNTPLGNPRYCDCFESDGNRCTNTETAEIRRVLIPNRLNVSVKVPDAISTGFSTSGRALVNFDPRSGGYVIGTGAPTSLIEAQGGFVVTTKADAGDSSDLRALRITVNGPGRVALCTPAGSPLGGEACP
jgi:type IV fimbrial biogenesis protein FimT